jgi:hypothetical protein
MDIKYMKFTGAGDARHDQENTERPINDAATGSVQMTTGDR